MQQIEQTITTVEIAEMMKMNHWEILRKLEGTEKLKGIISTLTDNKIVVSDYFQESTYQDASGKSNKCYKVTKLGCDFLANKFTGEKGVLFTALYVKRFHDMKETIAQGNILERLSPELQAIIMHDEKIKFITKSVDDQEKRITDVDNDLQNFKKDMPLLGIDLDRIKHARNHKIVPLLGGKNSNAYNDKSLRGRVYDDSARQIWREFGVGSFKEIKRSNVDKVIELIKEYELPMALKEEVSNSNAQMTMF